jgi:hypothetical protein
MKDLDVVSSEPSAHGYPRVQIETEPFRPGEVKIGVEQFDERLGWYTAASLRVPLAQVPALQEALASLLNQVRQSEVEEGKIIPLSFPD